MGDPQRAVRTYLDHLAVERGLAANTLASYRRDLRRYLGYLDQAGIDDLDRVSEATVTGFLVRLREGDAEHPALARPRRPGPWWRCGASTGSRSPTASRRRTRRVG